MEIDCRILMSAESLEGVAKASNDSVSRDRRTLSFASSLSSVSGRRR